MQMGAELSVTVAIELGALNDREPRAGNLHLLPERCTRRNVDADAVDGGELHHHRSPGDVVHQLKIVGEAARGIGEPPHLAVLLAQVDRRVLLTAHREEPCAAGEIVTTAGGVVCARTGSLAHLGDSQGILVAEIRVLLVEHLAVGDVRRSVDKRDVAGGQHLHVLEDEMADIGIGKRRVRRVAMRILADAADRDDPGEPLRHLVERDPMHVRMEPERAVGMIGRDVDTIIGI